MKEFHVLVGMEYHLKIETAPLFLRFVKKNLTRISEVIMYILTLDVIVIKYHQNVQNISDKAILVTFKYDLKKSTSLPLSLLESSSLLA